MKNKTFTISTLVCFSAVLLAETTLFTVPASMAWGRAWFTALSNFSIYAEKSLIPAVAAGLVVLLALGRLRLWQCSALGLSMVVLYALIYNLTSPLVQMYVSEAAVPYHISFSGIAVQFREAGHYLFPVFIGALAFYGFACKKRVVAVLCTAWSVVNWFVLHLLPPFFQRFDGRTLSMDEGSAVRIQLYFGLFKWSAVLLIVLIIIDLYDLRKITKSKPSEEKLLNI